MRKGVGGVAALWAAAVLLHITAVLALAAPLRLVVAPERNAFDLQRQYRPVVAFLAAATGLDVFLDVLPDYTSAGDMLADRRADGGFIGGYAYLEARRQGVAEPLARPVWRSGRASCRGCLVVRRDSGIENVAAMRGKRLVLTGPGCTTGYFFPFFYFANSGISSPQRYFSEILLAGGHDAALWSVFTGETDVGAVKDEVLRRMQERYPAIAGSMQVVARSSEIPSVCFVAGPSMPEDLRSRLRFLLLEMDKVRQGREALDRFGARRFVATVDADFNLLRRMLAEFSARGLSLDRPLFGEEDGAP